MVLVVAIPMIMEYRKSVIGLRRVMFDLVCMLRWSVQIHIWHVKAAFLCAVLSTFMQICH